MIIAVDFDGTIVEHRFPEIGNEIPFATTTLRMLAEQHNHRLILWTVRRGRLLEEAVEWCNGNIKAHTNYGYKTRQEVEEIRRLEAEREEASDKVIV